MASSTETPWATQGSQTSWITELERLEREGASLPSPELLDDETLTAKLWELIGRLAGKDIYLTHTDHLSDRELYTRLWHDALRDETPDSYDTDCFGHWIIDLVGSGSPDELAEWLRYYASEGERYDLWTELDEPELPRHVDPPFDRDRQLPRPVFVFDEELE